MGLAVLAVAAVIVLGATLRSHPAGPSSASPGANRAATPGAASVAARVTSVPASVFDAVGAGSVRLAPNKIDAPALTHDGKPLVMYVGGEFCPYCAVERWPLAVALSRFGVLDGLGEATSAPAPEDYPSTATLSFHGATFTSDYLALSAKEIFDEQHQPLDKLTSAETQVLSTYDQPPYLKSAGGIPFVDIGGRWVLAFAEYDPGVLTGLSHAQIAAELSTPESAVAQGVIGTANVLTAAMCQESGGEPATVCQSTGVKAAAQAMGVK